MRLIDADDVKKMLFDTFEKEKDVISSYWVAGTLTDKIDEVQTAYDVDKVVEQLEKVKRENTAIALNDFQKENCFWYRQGMDRAIEIVRRGGTNG